MNSGKIQFAVIRVTLGTVILLVRKTNLIHKFVGTRNYDIIRNYNIWMLSKNYSVVNSYLNNNNNK